MTNHEPRLGRLAAEVELMAAHVAALKTQVNDLSKAVATFGRMVDQMHDKLGLIAADLEEKR